MYDSFVALMNIGNTLIPCVGVLGIVHAHDMYNHLIDELSLSICLGVEGSGFGELDVHQ